MTMSSGQTPIPCVYLRGGSSKATFFKTSDIPGPGTLRDAVLKRVNGTPDPIQIDGLGGTRIVTSKIALVNASEREDADVDYTFCQLGIDTDTIQYDGNCGNISAGVGPFAIDEGIIKGKYREGVSMDKKLKAREVKIYNTGTGKMLIAHVPVDAQTGKSISEGDFAIAAVPGTGAPILMDYRNTIGAARNKGLLPTGNAMDEIDLNGTTVRVSICDVGNLCVFVNAKDVGLVGTETAKSITNNTTVIAKCKEVRGKAAQKLGMCNDWQRVDEESGILPLMVLVSAPPASGDADVTARLLLSNMCHDSMAGTGAICTTACSRIPGSVVALARGGKEAQPEEDHNVFRIAHPLGVMPVQVQLKGDSNNQQNGMSNDGTAAVEFGVLAFVRTARRIMDGHVYVPTSVWNGRDGLG